MADAVAAAVVPVATEAGSSSVATVVRVATGTAVLMTPATGASSLGT